METKPIDPRAIKAMHESVEKLPEDERVEFEERAAIMEYDGGLSKADAEWETWKRLLNGRV